MKLTPPSERIARPTRVSISKVAGEDSDVVDRPSPRERRRVRANRTIRRRGPGSPRRAVTGGKALPFDVQGSGQRAAAISSSATGGLPAGDRNEIIKEVVQKPAGRSVEVIQYATADSLGTFSTSPGVEDQGVPGSMIAVIGRMLAEYRMTSFGHEDRLKAGRRVASPVGARLCFSSSGAACSETCTRRRKKRRQQRGVAGHILDSLKAKTEQQLAKMLKAGCVQRTISSCRRSEDGNKGSRRSHHDGQALSSRSVCRINAPRVALASPVQFNTARGSGDAQSRFSITDVRRQAKEVKMPGRAGDGGAGRVNASRSFRPDDATGAAVRVEPA